MATEEIILLDVYNSFYKILKNISTTYKIDFNVLHELYLKDLHIKLTGIKLIE